MRTRERWWRRWRLSRWRRCRDGEHPEVRDHGGAAEGDPAHAGVGTVRDRGALQVPGGGAGLARLWRAVGRAERHAARGGVVMAGALEATLYIIAPGVLLFPVWYLLNR